MNQPLKKIIGILLVVFIFSVAYYGSYLPLEKSQSFIATLRSLQSLRSLKDFEDALSVPLDIPSPIGQEELVRNSSNIILNLVQQNNNPQVISELIGYLENYYRPIIDRGVGMSFEQNLYILGTLNETAFIKTNQPQYFLAAKKYYEQGLALGPRRPQFLYGMFDIYRTEGNVEKAKAVADQILSQWPDDQRIRDGLEKFLNYAASAAAKKKK